MAKEVVKADGGGAAVVRALEGFAVVSPNRGEMMQVLNENMGHAGSEGLSRLLPKVSVPAGGGLSWMVPTASGEVPQQELIGVIVGWSDGRRYWKMGIEEGGGGTPPDCSSADGLVGIGLPGGDCRKCPLSQFGSAVKANGQAGRGQACGLYRELLILPQNSLLPTIVQIPPSSNANVQKYFLQLASEQTPYYLVVTRVGLNRQKNKDNISFSEVTFQRQAAITAVDEADAIRAYRKAMGFDQSKTVAEVLNAAQGA